MNCFNEELERRERREKIEKVERREKVADNILIHMMPLEKDIEVLEKAMKNPPKGASKEEMSNVKQ